MAKGGGSQTTVQKSDPWVGQQPYLTQGFQAARNDVLGGPLPFAPMDPNTTQSLQMQRNLALDPDSLMNQASNYYGGILGSDPYSGPAADAAKDYVLSSVMPAVDSRFALGNRTGSGLHGEALGRGVALGLTPFMEGERNRQMMAAQLGPQAQLMAPGLLGNVGQAYQAQAQGMLDAPYNRLARYMGLVGGGGYGGQSTTSVPVQGKSPLMGGLGGAATGAYLGTQIMPGWGTAIGAVGGGLLGAFG